ncbi:MAG: hypothetical protein WA917_14730 [Comamonas sp.]
MTAPPTDPGRAVAPKIAIDLGRNACSRLRTVTVFSFGHQVWRGFAEAFCHPRANARAFLPHFARSFAHRKALRLALAQDSHVYRRL